MTKIEMSEYKSSIKKDNASRQKSAFEPLGTIPIYSLMKFVPELLEINFSSILQRESWCPYETAFFFANMNPDYCFSNTVSAKRFVDSFLNRLKIWVLIYQKLFREGAAPENEEEKLLKDIMPKNVVKHFFHYKNEKEIEYGDSNQSISHFFDETSSQMFFRNEKMKNFLEIILPYSRKPLAPLQWIEWATGKKIEFSLPLQVAWNEILASKGINSAIVLHSGKEDTVKKTVLILLAHLHKKYPFTPLKKLVQCRFIQLIKQGYSNTTILDWAKEAGIASPIGRLPKNGKNRSHDADFAVLEIPLP